MVALQVLAVGGFIISTTEKTEIDSAKNGQLLRGFTFAGIPPDRNGSDGKCDGMDEQRTEPGGEQAPV